MSARTRACMHPQICAFKGFGHFTYSKSPSSCSKISSSRPCTSAAPDTASSMMLSDKTAPVARTSLPQAGPSLLRATMRGVSCVCGWCPLVAFVKRCQAGCQVETSVRGGELSAGACQCGLLTGVGLDSLTSHTPMHACCVPRAPHLFTLVCLSRAGGCCAARTRLHSISYCT